MRRYKRRRKDETNITMYQQKWEVVKPAIQAALVNAMRG
jgi:hypothetical protein